MASSLNHLPHWICSDGIARNRRSTPRHRYQSVERPPKERRRPRFHHELGLGRRFEGSLRTTADAAVRSTVLEKISKMRLRIH
jgi:hypothetical protein